MSELERHGPPSRLIDSFGRVHDNLRISVTDRCNLRCAYCMPDNPVFMPKPELLRFEEIARVVKVAVGLGVRKLRLTGGEPLARADLPVLVEMLMAMEGVDDVGLTTNGILLTEQAAALFAAGLRRLNISLDTLRAETFWRMTRRNKFTETIRGIEAALAAGFERIKINAVAMRGVSEPELLEFARLARGLNLEIRFIEYMPLDGGHWRREDVLDGEEILARIGEVFPLTLDPSDDGHAPARRYVFEDGRGAIGVIASVSAPFCAQCNRLRLTSDGKIRNCLFALEEYDVKSLLREDGADEEIADVFLRAVQAKWAGHQINQPGFKQPFRSMNAIGG